MKAYYRAGRIAVHFDRIDGGMFSPETNCSGHVIFDHEGNVIEKGPTVGTGPTWDAFIARLKSAADFAD